MVVLVEGSAGSSEHDYVRHVNKRDGEIIVEAADILAAVVAVDIVRVREVLVISRAHEAGAEIDEADENESSDEQPFIPVPGEILEDFLTGGETGADQERDDCARELDDIDPTDFVVVHCSTTFRM